MSGSGLMRRAVNLLTTGRRREMRSAAFSRAGKRQSFRQPERVEQMAVRLPALHAFSGQAVVIQCGGFAHERVFIH